MKPGDLRRLRAAHEAYFLAQRAYSLAAPGEDGHTLATDLKRAGDALRAAAAVARGTA